MAIDPKEDLNEHSKTDEGSPWGGVLAKALRAAKPSLRDASAAALAEGVKTGFSALQKRKQPAPETSDSDE